MGLKERVVELLRPREPMRARALADDLNVECRDVNRVLYALKDEGAVTHDEARSTWTLKADQRSSSKSPRPAQLKSGRGASTPIRTVKNAEIMPERLALIARAQKSIWLASLTCPRPDLMEALVKRARTGVYVHVVFAERKRGDAQDRLLERLERAGGEWTLLRSTHSKVLVVDEHVVMNGSANAHGGHHDINHVFEDRAAARDSISELRRLIDTDPD